VINLTMLVWIFYGPIVVIMSIQLVLGWCYEKFASLNAIVYYKQAQISITGCY